MTEPSLPALPWLVRLMSTGEPLDNLSDSQVVEAVRLARQARLDAERRAAYELHSRQWIWEKIGAQLGVAQSTAYRWAQEYAKANDLAFPLHPPRVPR